ncbi:glycoside hydrolase family 18 protein [Streptomyces sp. SID3343]|uniref:chitinase n=1 Tax=Streptomyces sp. SID3343 TaxID=2690260 RepID=UPI001F197C34|nr:glycoside hydrolase family 18 protein [Streptomyces sp. SID3343]
MLTALSAIVAVVSASLIALASPARADAELLVNGGFESGLSGWTCSGGTGNATTTPVHAGAGALKATPAGADYARCAQTVAVQPNSDYAASAWVQGSYIYFGASGTGTSDVSTWTSSASTWQKLATTFHTGAATTSVTIYLNGWYGQAAYTADDVSLVGPGGTVTIPAVPTGLAVTATTARSVSLGWNAVPGATAYDVYRADTKVATVTGTSADIPGLTPETAYSFSVAASNSAGTSARTAPIAATTAPDGPTGGDPTGLPKRVMTGYWHNFVNGSTALRLRDVPTSYNLVAVAFAEADRTRNGAITFGVDPGLSTALGGYTDADLKADIVTMHARGQKVILSVGGELGAVWVGDAASSTTFGTTATALLREYGFDGIDIDLENGVNPTHMASALRAIRAQVGPSLIITMAPQTLDMQSTQAAYFVLALGIKDILTIVHMQYYNSGTMMGCDQGLYSQGNVNFITAQACIQLQNGLRPDQVSIGVPATGRAAGSGYVSPGVVNNALDCLALGTNCGSYHPTTTWPNIRGAMTWSANWDATNGYALAGSISGHLRTLP